MLSLPLLPLEMLPEHSASLTTSVSLTRGPYSWGSVPILGLLHVTRSPGSGQAGFCVGSREGEGWSLPLLWALRGAWTWTGSLGATAQGGGCSLHQQPCRLS